MKIKYWEEKHFDALEKATTYKELFLVAESVLKTMPAPIAQVCGPISTGGAGSVEKNLERFRVTIAALESQGIEVFNQMPFEIPMQKIKEVREGMYKKYDNLLLEDFYLPIFESGLVECLHFLPDWESSVGTRWEHEQAVRLGMKIEYLE
jgi:hypothetical protein